MRGVASSTHCGKKPSRQVPSEKTMSIVLYVPCSSAAAAVAKLIGQLQLQLSHYSLVALQAFCFPKYDFWGGLEKKFSRLAIARHIFRPPHKLCYNSTTAHIILWLAESDYVKYYWEISMWKLFQFITQCKRQNNHTHKKKQQKSLSEDTTECTGWSFVKQIRTFCIFLWNLLNAGRALAKTSWCDGTLRYVPNFKSLASPTPEMGSRDPNHAPYWGHLWSTGDVTTSATPHITPLLGSHQFWLVGSLSKRS